MPRKLEKRRLLRWKGIAEASSLSGPNEPSASSRESEISAPLDLDRHSQILEDDHVVSSSFASSQDHNSTREIVDRPTNESMEHPDFTAYGDTFMTGTISPSLQSSSSNVSAFPRRGLDLSEHDFSSTEDEMFAIVSLLVCQSCCLTEDNLASK